MNHKGHERHKEANQTDVAKEHRFAVKANLITAEVLELRQIPLCSFVPFVVNQFSGGELPSYAALCRWLEKNCHDKIVLLFETSGYDLSEETS